MATETTTRAEHTAGTLRVDTLGVLTGGPGGCTTVAEAPLVRWANAQVKAGASGDLSAADWCGRCHAEALANARRLALCWNTHDELAAACRSLLIALTTDGARIGYCRMYSESEWRRNVDEARAALARADGEAVQP